MPSILVQRLDLGLDALVSENLIDPRGAAQGTENILYEYGIMRTPFGFAKLDLTTTGLNSGDIVLGIIPYTESDRTSHMIAVTSEKLYEHNRIVESWDDKTNTDSNSDIFHPISFTAIAHNDTDVYLNDNSSQSLQYYHLIVCDGGMSNIQRWAGKYEATFRDVVGAGGYHDGTTHRALQVGTFKNRLLLISPLTYNSSSKVWITNKQRIQYPVISKLQTWTGTGSGFVDLVDTGGENVWSARLGSLYTIYQNNSIWDLGYVGGTKIFDPKPVIPELGLLAYHLLAQHGNSHYFVGSDYNVYVYYGGSIKQKIGDKIHRFLQEDLDPVYRNRCWMMLDEQNRWLYIFIVPKNSVYITKAYIMNISTGAWSVRDFSNTFGSGEGITAVSLVGSETYTTGDTYQKALDTLSTYEADVSVDTVGDVTIRYGDILADDTVNQVDVSTFADGVDDLDFTNMDFSKVAGAMEFDFSSGSDNTVILTDDTVAHKDWSTYSGMIMRIDDGSNTVGMVYGSHYYQLTDVCAVDNAGDWSITVHMSPRETGFAASVCSGGTTEEFNTESEPSDTTGSFYDPSGDIYSQALSEVLVDAKIVLGDATGFVYQMDEIYSTEDNNSIISPHLTPVIDLGEPGRFKRFNKLSYTAKEKTSGNGGVALRFRTGSFDTSETGWIATHARLPRFNVAANCIGLWKMNDNLANTTVIDYSGGGYHGVASANTSVLSTTGKIGRCLNMVGTNDITIPDNNTFSFGNGLIDSPFSIAAWVYTTLAGLQPIISKYKTAHKEWYLWLDSSRKVRMHLYDNSANAGIGFVAGFSIVHGIWVFIGMTYDGRGGITADDGMAFYVNGSKYGTSRISSGTYVAMENKNADIIIGGDDDDAFYFPDKLDTIMVFNSVLTPEEMLGLYNSGTGTQFLGSNVNSLTSDWEEYDAYMNRSSKRIQFQWKNASGSDFEIREAQLHYEMEGNR